MIDTEKARLRADMRKMRQALSPEVKKRAAQQLTLKVIQSTYFQNATHIAAYFALPEEINPQGILEAAFKMNKKCYLPVLGAGNCLSFAPFSADTKLVPNRFGILEPETGPSYLISQTDFELIMVPLVAFDLKGHRLGMGKGYYDRTFQRITNKREPVLLGLAFECQCVSSVPVDHNDVKLTAVATEQNMYHI